jgi:hypothetical protein
MTRALAFGVAALVSVTGGSASARVPRLPWLTYVRHGDVFVFNPRTHATHMLTAVRAAAAGDLAVSPDETRVAYTAKTGTFRSAIYVQSIRAGRAVNVTPWSGKTSAYSPRQLDPHWLDQTHVEFTSDASGSKPFGFAMQVDLATGRYGRLRMIPGGYDGPSPNGIMQPFVIAGRYSAYPRFDVGTGCLATSDLVRGTGTTRTLLTATPTVDEEPRDIAANGAVLALRYWVSAGRHHRLCTSGGRFAMDFELLVLDRRGHGVAVRRFAPVWLRSGAAVPNVDAAWSPDGKEIAYTTPRGVLVIRTLSDGRERVIARGVEALDW